MTDPDASPLAHALRDLEHHVAEGGWDQPTRLFALVLTADLIAREPHLAAALPAPVADGDLTSLEQDGLPAHEGPVDLLAQVTWPESVDGVALVTERFVMTSGRREEVRLVVGVTRRDDRWSLVRLRSHDHDSDVLQGPALVPELADAVAASLVD